MPNLFQVVNVIAGLLLMASCAVAARRLWSMPWLRLVCLLVFVASGMAVLFYLGVLLGLVPLAWGSWLLRPVLAVILVGCAVLIDLLSRSWAAKGG